MAIVLSGFLFVIVDVILFFVLKDTAFCSLVLDNLVVIELFVVGYFLIDRRQVKKEKNAETIAKSILLETYRSCLKELDFLESVYTKKAIIDMNEKPVFASDHSLYREIMRDTFEHEDILLELIKEGLISSEVCEKYWNIKLGFQTLVNGKITYADKPNFQNPAEPVCIDMLTQEISKLEKELGK